MPGPRLRDIPVLSQPSMASPSISGGGTGTNIDYLRNRAAALALYGLSQGWDTDTISRNMAMDPVLNEKAPIETPEEQKRKLEAVARLQGADYGE